MDLFVVPILSFRLLCGLSIVGHGRRQILWFPAISSLTPTKPPGSLGGLFRDLDHGGFFCAQYLGRKSFRPKILLAAS
jgi:hypothetical protein